MARNAILLISGKLSNSEMTTISGLNLSYIQDCLPALPLPAAALSSRGRGSRACAMLLQPRCGWERLLLALMWLYPLLLSAKTGWSAHPPWFWPQEGPGGWPARTLPQETRHCSALSCHQLHSTTAHAEASEDLPMSLRLCPKRESDKSSPPSHFQI